MSPRPSDTEPVTHEPDRRLLNTDDGWQWICPICNTARPVEEHRRCGHCGKDSLSSAGRRLGAALRNSRDAIVAALPRMRA